MKKIILFRHGKSDWKASYASDHERPLARRGEAAADRMGRFLAAAGEVPDLAVTSTAVRASETLRRAILAGGWRCRVEESDELYLASSGELLSYIRFLHESDAAVVLVGHEPSWSALLARLVGGGAFRFPTATMARIDLDVGTWDEVDFGMGELRWLVIPRLLTR